MKLGFKRNGKIEYAKQIEIPIGLDITKTVILNEERDYRIDLANSYYISSNITLPICQYHTPDDWARAYCYTTNITIEFGSVYSSLEKIAYITICYTKN